MKKLLKSIFFIFFIVIILECTIFNYRYWESIFYPSNTVCEFSTSGMSNKSGNVWVINDSTQAAIELSNINANVYNLYLPVIVEDKDKLDIVVSYNDEGNQLYYDCVSRSLIRNVPLSDYIRIHPMGKSRSVKVQFSSVGNGDSIVFDISQIQLNKKYPFIFLKLRIGFLWLVLFLLYWFRPSSEIYQINIELGKKNQKIIVSMFVLLWIVAFWLIGAGFKEKSNTNFWNVRLDENSPIATIYQEYAISILEGHLYLDRSVPDYIMEMENPYDTTLRNQLAEETGIPYAQDNAYYNGKYYCYFGIIPAILFFVPYRMLTGNNLPTKIIVEMLGFSFVIFSFVLIYEFIKKYYKNSSLGLYLLLTSVFIVACNAPYLVNFPIIYSIPLISGLCFVTAGLCFWLRAEEDENINRISLFIGSVLISLTLGCRPQLFLSFVLAIPIFINSIKKRRLFAKSKTAIINTTIALLPFLLNGSLMMYTNYIRFNSPFNFGATYNLVTDTGDDLAYRGFAFDRFFIYIFEYLFQPLNIKSKFPFLYLADVLFDYQGFTYFEPMWGGFFAQIPILIVCFLNLKIKKYRKKMRAFLISLFSLLIAIFNVLLDSQMIGGTARYMADFGIFFGISGIMMILFYNENITINKKYAYKTFMTSIVWLGVISIIIAFWSFLIMGRWNSLETEHPIIFYSIKYAFPFAL